MLVHSFILLLVSGASQQCSDKIRFFISTPGYLEGLEGSCLLIPCTFNIKEGDSPTDPTLNYSSHIHGIWLTKGFNTDFTVFNSSKPDAKYPMQLLGNLRENNCSTLFFNLEAKYSETYFFRIENIGFSSYACAPLKIKVSGSTPEPTINISGTQKENREVEITCSAAAPCPQHPPTLTWNLTHQPTIIREKNINGTFTFKIQQTLRLSDHHDGLNIHCSASYPVNNGTEVKISETSLTLNVSYAPKDTRVQISPSAEVPAGTLVNLSCSSRANPPVLLFSWFKLGTEGAVYESGEDLFTVIVTERGDYYCVATNREGSGTSEAVTLSIPGSEVHWWIILGGIAGILVFFFIGLTLGRLYSARRRPPLPESERAEDGAVTDEVQYGQIVFLKHTQSEAGREQEEDTVYARVNKHK